MPLGIRALCSFRVEQTVTNRYENGAIKITGNCAKARFNIVVLIFCYEKDYVQTPHIFNA